MDEEKTVRKLVILFLLFLALYIPPQVLAVDRPNFPPQVTYAPGEIIVKFKKGESPAELEVQVAAQNVRGQTFLGNLLNQ